MVAIYEREDSGAMLSIPVSARHDAVRSKVLKLCELRTYKRGEIVCREGDRNAPILILSSGTLGGMADDGRGGSVMVAPFFRGRVFNVMGLSPEGPSFTTLALSTANVFVLSHEKGMELKGDIQFEEWCTACVVSNLSHVINFAAALRVTDIDHRIVRMMEACYLQMHERSPEGDYEIEWQLKQQEFSSLLNITRPYLNERLKLLKQKGVRVIENERAIVRPSLLPK